jgi:hypothetical protein
VVAIFNFQNQAFVWAEAMNLIPGPETAVLFFFAFIMYIIITVGVYLLILLTIIKD